MPAITLNLSRSSTAPGWDSDLPDHDALWEDFAAGYLYSRVGAPTIIYDSLRSSDPATGGRSDTFDASAGSLDLVARNFGGAVSLDWSGGRQAATLRLDAAWHTIENIAVTEFSGATLELENWVDVAVILGGSRDRQISVDGAKRAEIVTGGGDDSIFAGLDSDGRSETNFLRIAAGGGDDSITVGLATRDYSGTFSSAAYRVKWSHTELWGEDGNDTIAGGPSADRIDGGNGLDTVLLDGARADYRVESHGQTTVVRDLRTGSARLDGTDRLTHVEFLQFSDAMMALPQGGFGVVSLPLDLGTALLDASPLFLTSSIDFLDNPYDSSDFDRLSLGAQTLLSASPPQSLSEGMSFEVLGRLVGATLLKTGAEIDYDTAGKMADYSVEIDGIRIGVEVSRAATFPLGSPYTTQQARLVLTSALNDIVLSTANVGAADRWQKEILLVFSVDAQATDALAQAYAELDAVTKADTIVIVTQSEGNDHFLFS